jgi:hypothetical protein
LGNNVIFCQTVKEQNLELHDSGDTEEQSTYELSALFIEEAFKNRFNIWHVSEVRFVWETGLELGID